MIELSSDDIATISYTSGTTGNPKGAINTHGNLLANALNIARWMRVDDETGSISIGVPIFGTDSRIVDEESNTLGPGEVGELAISGPQVTPGYWQKPEATAESIPGGELRTGDVAFHDEDGWYYIVDRKKDLINASGYKVWPREVEDAIYLHKAVKEVAVVGIPDAYRGESVKAVIKLKPGASLTAEELTVHCRELLASYKCPRVIDFVDELPKTASGKILRRELRD